MLVEYQNLTLQLRVVFLTLQVVIYCTYLCVCVFMCVCVGKLAIHTILLFTPSSNVHTTNSGYSYYCTAGKHVFYLKYLISVLKCYYDLFQHQTFIE